MQIGAPYNLLSALDISGGVVCLTGAGGKKTVMYELASTFGGRVALTSTSRMFEYDKSVVDRVIAPGNITPKPPSSERVVAYAEETDTPHRVGGLMPSQIETIFRKGEYDLIVIKADGARSRLIKAPAEHEPLIPDFTELVVPLVSGRVIEQPLTKIIAHRADLLAKVMEMEIGEVIKPLNLARLLSSQTGSLQGTKNIRVVPVINMVDNRQVEEACVEAASIAFSQTNRFDRIVLCELRRSKLVRVIDRPLCN
jgi:probable selenium-dependent hydroxylase accessory protein YqeC